MARPGPVRSGANPRLVLPRSSLASGASVISCTSAPARRIASSLRISGWLALTSLSR